VHEWKTRFEKWFNDLSLTDQWEYVLRLTRERLPNIYSTLYSIHDGLGACWSVEQLLDTLVFVSKTGFLLHQLSTILETRYEKRSLPLFRKSRMRILYKVRLMKFVSYVLGLYERSLKKSLLIAVKKGETMICEGEGR